MNCHIIYNNKLAQGLITGISDVRSVVSESCDYCNLPPLSKDAHKETV